MDTDSCGSITLAAKVSSRAEVHADLQQKNNDFQRTARTPRRYFAAATSSFDVTPGSGGTVRFLF
jgi:hypothetical protein